MCQKPSCRDDLICHTYCSLWKLSNMFNIAEIILKLAQCFISHVESNHRRWLHQSYVHFFWHNTGVWRTDRWTDRNAIALTQPITTRCKILILCRPKYDYVDCWRAATTQRFSTQANRLISIHNRDPTSWWNGIKKYKKYCIKLRKYYSTNRTVQLLPPLRIKTRQ